MKKSNSTGKKTYLNIGAVLRKKEKDADGNPTYWLKLDEKADVVVNGVKVTALNIQRPTEKYDRMLKSGKITAEEYEQKTSRYFDPDDLEYVTFEVVAAIE
jgi:hypothetical protein